MRPSTKEEAEERVWKGGSGAGWSGPGPDGLVAWRPRTLVRDKGRAVRLARAGRTVTWPCRGGARSG